MSLYLMLSYENTVMLLCAVYRGKQATFSGQETRVLDLYSVANFLVFNGAKFVQECPKYPRKYTGNTKLHSQT